jgi:hypothetical protein
VHHHHDTDKDHDMPAREFLDKFAFDPATFQFDQFKEKLLSEIDGDTEISTSAITERDTELKQLRGDKVSLQSKLWEATIAKQGDPVRPTDSPAAPGPTSAPSGVKDSDIFGAPENIHA